MNFYFGNYIGVFAQKFPPGFTFPSVKSDIGVFAQKFPLGFTFPPVKSASQGTAIIEFILVIG